MRLHIHCVSKRPAAWVSAACDEYLKRLRAWNEVSLLEVPPVAGKRTPARRRSDEAASLRRVSPALAFTVALDERGREWTTSELATALDDWRGHHADVVFLIGGADGLDAAFVGEAHHRWSLSRLTLPHQLARVVLCEQLYRAFSTLHNHPYHRA